jgi:drug/metabolite transporter (DMT)-like permease|tara:strand:- start:122 stop:1009 length:888 start_codon:yes stop_codon:yes gene_type:complete
MRPHVTPIDGLLLLMTIFWGSNFSIVKVAISEFPAFAFNTVRMAIAAILFLGLLRFYREPLPPRSDWPTLVGLAIVGHFFYQLCFIEGIVRTSVSNSSLILGLSPVFIAILMLCRGSAKVSAVHWLGISLSFAGLYLIVGRQASVAMDSVLGDVFMLGAVLCWAVYTVFAKKLLTRHSPLVVTAWTFIIGTVLFLPVGFLELVQIDWMTISGLAWAGLTYSAIFALVACYLIWSTAVQRIGSARTAIYANVVPVPAMIIAALWLHEPIGFAKVAGALAILVGVGLTKIQRVTSSI